MIDIKDSIPILSLIIIIIIICMIAFDIISLRTALLGFLGSFSVHLFMYIKNKARKK